jgi:hypothetical protein
MIARVIYEGQLGETLRDVLPELIEKAKIIETYFYLAWNGVCLIICPDSTVEELLEKYNNHFRP